LSGARQKKLLASGPHTRWWNSRKSKAVLGRSIGIVAVAALQEFVGGHLAQVVAELSEDVTGGGWSADTDYEFPSAMEFTVRAKRAWLFGSLLGTRSPVRLTSAETAIQLR